MVTGRRVPEDYKSPSYEVVVNTRDRLRERLRPFHTRVTEVKQGRRGIWDDVLRQIPPAWRPIIGEIDVPQFRDTIQRVSGIVGRSRPTVRIRPPTTNTVDHNKADHEEKCLNALIRTLEQQQNRPAIHQLGYDGQVAYGLSAISLVPDPDALDDFEMARGDDEDAASYMKRTDDILIEHIPLILTDHDPQTLFWGYSDRERIAFVIEESDHEIWEIETHLGYTAIRDEEGSAQEWVYSGKTLSEAIIIPEVATALGTTHSGVQGGVRSSHATASGQTIRKLVYIDEFSYKMWLGSVLVEEWQHDFGLVPYFFAWGEQSSDRDPAWASIGIADAALTITKQIVMWTAIITANGSRHAWPTPFMKSNRVRAEDPLTGQLATVPIKIGEINVIGLEEDVYFPYLQGAQTNPDFKANLDWLLEQLDLVSLQNFGRAIGTDISGYAVNQIREMQLAILSSVYNNAKKQWTDIASFLRVLVDRLFPSGLVIPGAKETNEDDMEAWPNLTYGEREITNFELDVEIEMSIPQDDFRVRESAANMVQAGLWSTDTAMREIGVENPQKEMEKINRDRFLALPQVQEFAFAIAQEFVMEKVQNVQQAENTPLSQLLGQSRDEYMGASPNPNMGPFPENSEMGIPQNQLPNKAGVVGSHGGGQPGNSGGGPITNVGVGQQTPSGPRR